MRSSYHADSRHGSLTVLVQQSRRKASRTKARWIFQAVQMRRRARQCSRDHPAAATSACSWAFVGVLRRRMLTQRRTSSHRTRGGRNLDWSGPVASFYPHILAAIFCSSSFTAFALISVVPSWHAVHSSSMCSGMLFQLRERFPQRCGASGSDFDHDALNDLPDPRADSFPMTAASSSG